jgi:hypothetical protein
MIRDAEPLKSDLGRGVGGSGAHDGLVGCEIHYPLARKLPRIRAPLNLNAAGHNGLLGQAE